jgi:hypothetical protein
MLQALICAVLVDTRNVYSLMIEHLSDFQVAPSKSHYRSTMVVKLYTYIDYVGTKVHLHRNTNHVKVNCFMENSSMFCDNLN